MKIRRRNLYIHTFSNREINKFKTLLRGKKDFYSHLNIEDIEDITEAE